MEEATRIDTSQGKKRYGVDVPRLADHVENITGRLTNILTAQERSGTADGIHA
jgi:hypothetical protein